MYQPKQEDWHKQPYMAPHEKITVEEIESVFFGNLKKYPIINQPKEPYYKYYYTPEWIEDSKRVEEKYGVMAHYLGVRFLDQEPHNVFNAKNDYERKKLKEEIYKKRLQARGLAKCLWTRGKWNTVNLEVYQKCRNQFVRAVLTRSEKSKKRMPGSIFYALSPIIQLIGPGGIKGSGAKLVFFTYNPDEKPVPGMVCSNPIYVDAEKLKQGYRDYANPKCAAFDKSTLKKLEKFKKDPSNEEVLGKKFIKYIKKKRMVKSMHAKIGTNDYYWPLIGDMLNDVVVDVKKTNISPDLQKRRALLKKYSLILRGIKKKLDEDKYKSIDKDVSKLSKTYKDLKALTTTNEMAMNIDEAVDNIFDTNKLIQKSLLNSKDNEAEKLLALSSIYFMQSLIDSILSTIPEKYYAETKELSRDLFNDDEIETLEVIIDTMINKNKEIKSAELTKSMDIINNYINTSDVLKTLDNLVMKNSINREFTQNTAAGIANQEIRDNLVGTGIMKGLNKMLQNIDTKELSDLTKEASAVASEVASDPSVNESFSILDKKFGGHSLRKLIYACRTGRSVAGHC